MVGIIVAGLSFEQSIAVEALKALFIGVIAAGGILLAKRVLTGQREKHQLRVDLVRRTSTSMQGFYIKVQALRRASGAMKGIGALPENELAQKKEKLKEAYESWSTEAAALEAELGAYFGSTSSVVTDWHQLRDLLTVAYFALVHPTPGTSFEASSGIRNANAKRFNPDSEHEELHSGLDAEGLRSLRTVMKTFARVSPGFGSKILRAGWVVSWVSWGEA